jgi:hypothetical protein
LSSTSAFPSDYNGNEYDDNNPGQRDEDGIQAATEIALRKLNEADAKTKEDHNKVEAEDEKRKIDIIRDYAKNLTGKIPTGSSLRSSPSVSGCGKGSSR